MSAMPWQTSHRRRGSDRRAVTRQLTHDEGSVSRLMARTPPGTVSLVGSRRLLLLGRAFARQT
jgi:hypothetical protein